MSREARSHVTAGLALAAIMLAYLGLAIPLGRTAPPIIDEAWFADPAYNWIHHGLSAPPYSRHTECTSGLPSRKSIGTPTG